MLKELTQLERESLGALWASRIENSTDVYDLWAQKFKVEKLEEFYYGKQWDAEFSDYIPYVKNQFFTGIDIKQPSVLFNSPKVTIKAKPSRGDWNPEESNKRAEMREWIANYFVQSDYMDFAGETGLAILDSYFRFGIIEVGYSADWVDNPRAQRGELESDYEETFEGELPEILSQPPKLPKNERLYVKRIPSKRFRVGGLDHQNLDKCSWCGYKEWIKLDDLRSHPKIQSNIVDLLDISRSFDYSDINEANADERDEKLLQGDITEVWKIWDRYTHNKYLISGQHILLNSKYKRLPLFALKWRERLDSFYPFPITFNWISPQIETNETREAARAHRKMFQRKLIVGMGAFDEEEKDKLQRGGDGTIITSNKPNINDVIAPVPNADLSVHNAELMLVGKSDFDEVAGQSAQARGEAAGERTTATETNIINMRAGIRESRDVQVVSNFIAKVVKEIILQAKEKLTEDFWIKVAVESEAEFGERGAEFIETWRQIKLDELGDEDFDVNVVVSSLSPIEDEKEKQSFLEFLAVLTAHPHILLDVDLVREAALKVGYKNERIIRKFQQTALASQLALMQQASGAQGGNNSSQNRAAKATPNGQEQANNNVSNVLQ